MRDLFGNNAPTVGRSERTPAKHALMDKLIGQECGVGSAKAAIDKCVIIDLTAGDGASYSNGDWFRHCSPGLIAYHACLSRVPVEGYLYEVKPATFGVLAENLNIQLPKLGYRLDAVDGSEIVWICDRNKSRLLVRNASGSAADTSMIRSGVSVLVTNDPNSVNDWAMRSTFAREIRIRSRLFRSISTMGCNVGGLKRLELKDRQLWYDHIGRLVEALDHHHDLYIAAIDGDSAQWAYLVETSSLDTWRDRLERGAKQSFLSHGFSLRTAWFRNQRQEFDAIIDVLFKTKKELAA